MKILKEEKERIIVQSDIHKVLDIVEINNQLFIKYGYRLYGLYRGEILEMCR